jgi:hypothetical protein
LRAKIRAQLQQASQISACKSAGPTCQRNKSSPLVLSAPARTAAPSRPRLQRRGRRVPAPGLHAARRGRTLPQSPCPLPRRATRRAGPALPPPPPPSAASTSSVFASSSRRRVGWCSASRAVTRSPLPQAAARQASELQNHGTAAPGSRSTERSWPLRSCQSQGISKKYFFSSYLDCVLQMIVAVYLAVSYCKYSCIVFYLCCMTLPCCYTYSSCSCFINMSFFCWLYWLLD